MHAFILAGGFATRLWPLTEHRAKPLLPLAGKPILSHMVEKIPAEIPVTVSTNAVFAEGFADWRKQHPERRIEILIERTTNDDEKLGALGAVAQWVREHGIVDDVLLLTGDNYFGFSFERFLKAYRPGTPILAAYDIRDRDRASAFGTVILGSDARSITGFEEKPKNPQSTLVSTGCSVLPASTLPALLSYAVEHPDNVGGIFEEFLRLGQPVDSFTFAEPWFDIGSFDAYLEATKTLVGDRVTMPGAGAHLSDTSCEGSVVIGAGSRVTGGTLRDTVLFENVVLNDCVLERCIIDNNCVLSGIDLTGKMLREGTILKTDKY